MPLIVEHLRMNPKSHPDARTWDQVDHLHSLELTLTMSCLIEEDGGPKMAYGSGYGVFARRREVDNVFSQDYPLPDGQPIKRGDRIRMWRE